MPLKAPCGAGLQKGLQKGLQQTRSLFGNCGVGVAIPQLPQKARDMEVIRAVMKDDMVQALDNLRIAFPPFSPHFPHFPHFLCIFRIFRIPVGPPRRGFRCQQKVEAPRAPTRQSHLHSGLGPRVVLRCSTLFYVVLRCSTLFYVLCQLCLQRALCLRFEKGRTLSAHNTLNTSRNSSLPSASPHSAAESAAFSVLYSKRASAD